MQAQAFLELYRPQLKSEQKWLLKVSGCLASRSNFVQKLALKYLHVSQ
jgi:hypothetical protein